MQHRIQRSVRINDGQLLGLAEKARYDSRLSGFLHKRCSDSNKWLLRWFRLYQVRPETGLYFEKNEINYCKICWYFHVWLHTSLPLELSSEFKPKPCKSNSQLVMNNKCRLIIVTQSKPDYSYVTNCLILL